MRRVPTPSKGAGASGLQLTGALLECGERSQKDNILGETEVLNVRDQFNLFKKTTQTEQNASVGWVKLEACAFA